MYSVVLMTALTAGSATPAWHHCGGCWGCGGCGCCCGGCGGGCNGGCFGDCYGCFGGGYGDGYGGGYSDGYGCWGGYSNWSFGDMFHHGTVGPGVYGMTSGTVAPGTGTSAEEPDKPKTNKKNDDK